MQAQLTRIATMVAVLGASGATAAEPGDAAAGERIKQAERLYEQLYVRAAAREVEAALRAGHNSLGQLLRLHRLRARVAAAEGRHTDALVSGKRLLILAGQKALTGDLEPRLQRAFAEAQQWWRAAGAPRIKLRATLTPSPSTIAVRGRLKIEGDVLSLAHRAMLRLHPSGRRPRSYPASPASGWGWRLARNDLPIGRRLEARVELLDAHANSLAEARLPPVSIIARPAPSAKVSPFYRKWWFWTAVGVVVAGAATATAVTLASQSDDLPLINGTLPPGSISF